MILQGGTQPEHIAALAEAVAESYAAYQAGSSFEPIIMVDPGVASEENTTYRPDTAFVVRTSGSTSGTGKRVELPWSSIEASVNATINTLGGPADWLVTLPIHHVAGLQTVIRSVITGHQPVPFTLGDSVQPGAYISLVPTHLHRVLQCEDRYGLETAGAILVGGAATSARELQVGREKGLNLVTTYGMSETCGGCVYNGLPIGDTSISIVDGAVVITGSVVASGYVDGPAFDGTFTTQDAGRFRDGRLTILGRIDDAITTGGLTINPHLIEAFLSTHTTIPLHVIGVPDATWGERVVVVSETELPDVSEQLRSELGNEHVPKQWLTLSDLSRDSWPTRSSGKVDRRALIEIVRNRGDI